MGRKSRLKRERRALDASIISPTSPSVQEKQPELHGQSLIKRWKHTKIPKNLPSKLYRFFDKKEFADDFVNGKLRISTLETCRNHENKAQGDAEEGYMFNYIKRIHSSHPRFHEISNRGGICMVDSENCVIENNTYTEYIEDAYLLCTTTKYHPEDFTDDFGSYCVEITDPLKMMEIITQTLHSTSKVTHCKYSEVKYRSRTFQQEEIIENLMEFLKPDTDIYMSQNEFRFVWYTEISPITPINIECGSFSEFCKIIH